MFHQPVSERLLAHLRDRHGVDAVAATQVSVHRADVFRIDKTDGDPWIARAFPPARPRAGAEGDAAILRFLARHDYPAERLAVDDAVSDFEGSSVLVTQLIQGEHIPPFTDNMTVMADLLGRLHALPLDDTVSRPGGAADARSLRLRTGDQARRDAIAVIERDGSGPRTMCGTNANTISFSRCSVLVCEKRYLRIGIDARPGIPLRDFVC